jgi:WD40 repeat protein
MFATSDSRNHNIQLWSVSPEVTDSGLLKGHTGSISCVCFSADCTVVATAGTDKTARVWDISSQAEIHCIKHESNVTTVYFNSGSDKLLTRTEEAALTMWDLVAKKVIFKFQDERPRHVWDLESPACFSADDSYIISSANQKGAAGDLGTMLAVWEASTGRLKHKLANKDAEKIAHIAPSPLGDTVATAMWNGKIIIWDIINGVPLCDLWGHTKDVRGTCFNMAADKLVSVGMDGLVIMWNLRTREKVHKLSTSMPVSSFAASIAFGADDTTFVVAFSHGSISVHDTLTGEKKNKLAVDKWMLVCPVYHVASPVILM